MARTSRRVFVGTLAVYLALAGGHLYTADDWSRFHAARSVLLHGSPAIPHQPHVYSVPGRDGMRVSHFPPGLSLAAMPFVMAGHVVARLGGVEAERGERLGCSLVNQVVMAWLVASLARLLVRGGVAQGRAVGLAVAAAFGSLAFPYAKHFWAEPLQAALLLAAWLILWDLPGAWHRYLAFSAALAASVVVKYESAIPALVFCVGMVVLAPPKGVGRIAGALVPWAAATALVLGYNWWRFGSVWDFGYSGLVVPKTPQVTEAGLGFWPFSRRLVFLMCAPGQGLWVFVPVSALAMVGAARLGAPQWRVGVLAGACSWVTYALLDRSCTWCWGPRYLFPSMVLWWPGLQAVQPSLGPLRRVLVGLSVAIALLGVLVNFHDAIEEIRAEEGFTGWEWVQPVHSDPRLSPVLWHARLLGPYLVRTVRDGLAAEHRPDPVWWRHRHIDVVWLILWAGGAPWPVLLIPLVLLGVGYGCLRRAMRGDEG